MTFRRLSEYFQELESTTLRNSMVEILSRLFKESESGEIDKLSYLLQGRVAPLYEAVEFGMADRMMIRAIVQALGVSVETVTKSFQEEGDLGKTVLLLKSKFQNPNSKSTPIKSGAIPNPKFQIPEIDIKDVFMVLYKVAVSGGEGSQENKIHLLAELINKADSLSAKYIVRILLNKLRLGFSDMTVLDALSWMIKGTKEYREEIEKAYNVRPDLGYITKLIKEKGISGIGHIKPCIGTPIQMTRAERMSTGLDIIEKLGKCAIEPKYDGFRLQIHYSKKIKDQPRFNRGQKSKIQNKSENLSLFKNEEEKEKEYVKLFSRNMEDVTLMYPDVADGVRKQVKAEEAIFEGEAIGINIKTGQYLPFQETVQRKRKYNIEVKAKEIPLKLFTFDLLYKNGESLLLKSFSFRRSELEKTIQKGEDVYVARQDITSDPAQIEKLFEDAANRGLEGIMAKKLDGIYRAGARDFTWIKYKKSYSGTLTDTIDCVVMGYDYGQGKRSGFGIGDFLIGVYDKTQEKFVSVSKIGTGLTDEEWRELKIKAQKSKIKNIPENYDVDKMMGCDVWVEPKIVVEIRADEITRSPVHTAGRVMKPSKSGNAEIVEIAGFALRFPRLEHFRDDKSPKEATTVEEMKRLFELQGKK